MPVVIGHDAQGRPLYDENPYPPVYVGLDVSLTGTGVAVIEAGKPPRVGVFRSRPKGPELEQRARRVMDLVGEVMGFVMTDWDSEGDYRVAIEEPLPGNKTEQAGNAWDRAYLWWTLASRFIGVNPLSQVNPSTLKTFGFLRGSAPAGADGKALMMARAAQDFPGVDFIDNNGCDALFLAEMVHAHYEPDTALIPLLVPRVKALKAVHWS